MVEFKNLEELIKFYKKFENQNLASLFQFVKEKYPEISLTTNKGIAGQILEAVVGNPPNSNPNPDIENLSVELKVLPLRKISNRIQPKERSKIKSINFNKIASEYWPTSELRNKISKILFLLYEQPTGKTYKDWKEFKFRGTLYYELEKQNEDTVQEDWEGIKYKVKSESAHELSERDGKILGACTSGTGKLLNYGNGKQAKQRSYSLKHSYLKVYYSKHKKKETFSSLKLDTKVSPETYVLHQLNRNLKGLSLMEITEKYKVDFSKNSKSSFSKLINRVLKIDNNNKILELEEKGILVKTIPVNQHNNPWESMSFPKFSLVDLTEEEWNGDSEPVFKTIISHGYIFIPIIKEKEKVLIGGKMEYKFKHWTTWTIGESIYWQANDSELAIIESEWEKAKQIVENGVKVKYVKHGRGLRQENNLLKSTDTIIIHIRPHATNADDIDYPYFEFTNNKIRISWQSFWLNKSYTSRIISNNRIR